MIVQLAIHCTPDANPSAADRMRLGNISPSSTHRTGPHETAYAITNTSAATSAITPEATSRSGRPWTVDAPVKTTVMVASINAIPADPASNSGLRPTLSISAIATSVIRTLTPVVTNAMVNDDFSPNPTASQSTSE